MIMTTYQRSELRWRLLLGWQSVLQRVVGAPVWYRESDLAYHTQERVNWQIERGMEEYVTKITGKAPEKLAWKGYKELGVGGEDVERFKALSFDESELIERLAELTMEGYKVSVTWDGKNSCTIVSLTCQNPKSPNAGYTMTSRGPDMLGALGFALYKHFEVAGGDWSSEEANSSGGYG